MSVPPNVGPPKHLVFRDAGIEGKLRQQLVYQAYVTKEDMAKQKFFLGNRLVLKFKEEVLGEGQIILITEGQLQDLTPYDAVVSGYEKAEDLVAAVARDLLGGSKDAEYEDFYKVLYRWL